MSQRKYRVPLAGIAICFAGLANAAMVRLEIKDRTDVLNGKSFGKTGAYERIVGRAYFTVDPKLPLNQQIADIGLAPKNKDGLVEFSADLYMIRPKDPAKGNGTILYEVANRGARRLLAVFNNGAPTQNPSKPEDFGDGLLMDEGYTLLWLGWQFDLPGNGYVSPLGENSGGQADLNLYPPVIQGVKGVVRAEMTPDSKVTSMSVADRNHKPYLVLNPGDPNLKLTVRDKVEGPRTALPRESWHIENRSQIVIPAGFQPGRIYELVYTAENPPVAGTGFAVVRDTISWLKHGGNVDGGAGLDARYQRAIGFGISQSGRWLRTMMYYGFNKDERNFKVLDGVMSVVSGAGRGGFNMRFAQPSRDSNPFFNTLTPVDLFPFTDLEQKDTASNLKDGLLTHTLTKEYWPKIFYMNSSHEYYGRAAALIHMKLDGSGDAALAPDTRIYLFTGGQHAAAPFPPAARGTQFLPSPTPYPMTFRALLLDMNAWIKDGKEPPASRYPLMSKGELVPLGHTNFPKIPGIEPPKIAHYAYPSDYGPDFRSKGIVTKEPPEIGKPYPAFVPQVDADGIDIAGVKMPEVQVPLATYTGWNYRSKEIGAPEQLYTQAGSTIPFSRTKAERMQKGDPRPSIEERYSSKEEYLAKFEAAANSLVKDGFLLPQDVARLVKRGSAEWDFFVAGP